MAISSIRRFLLLLVGILLTLNGAFLGLARFSASSADQGPKTFAVKASVVDPVSADRIVADLEGMALVVERKTLEKAVPVKNGYRLVMRGKDLVAGVSPLLKSKKIPFSVGEGGSVLQLGGVFPDQAAAKKRAAEVLRRHKLNFQVVDSFKQVKKKVQVLTLASVPKQDLEAVSALIRPQAFEFVARPLEKPGQDPAGGT